MIIRRSPAAALVLAVFCVLARAENPAHAWADHFRVTRAALRDLPAVAGVTVTVTSFESLIKALGYPSELAFNEAFQFNKKYRFEFKASETLDKPISALDVLAKYSDEPDWGMDLEIFEPDEYPDLWKDSYAMMGGKHGTSSQAFRHMFWEKLQFAHPLETFKLPLSSLFKDTGEAPYRARLFVELSRKARGLGRDYWSVRFLANALHYLEDCAQPFHTSQVPTKRFLFFPFREKGSGIHQYVTQVTNVISYYHFAFEFYVAKLMEAANSPAPSAEGQAFVGYLANSPDRGIGLDYSDKDPATSVRSMAAIAVVESATAARASVDFFPPIQQHYAEMDAKAELTPQWWEQTSNNGKSDSPAKRSYFEAVRNVFGPLGHAIRAVVRSELGISAPDPHDPQVAAKNFDGRH